AGGVWRSGTEYSPVFSRSRTDAMATDQQPAGNTGTYTGHTLAAGSLRQSTNFPERLADTPAGGRKHSQPATGGIESAIACCLSAPLLGRYRLPAVHSKIHTIFAPQRTLVPQQSGLYPPRQRTGFH